MPVEHPGEDQVRQRDGVLDRLPDRVGQVEAVEPLVEGAAERVQEHDGAELGGARPERVVARRRTARAAGAAAERARRSRPRRRPQLRRASSSAATTGRGAAAARGPSPVNRAGSSATKAATPRFAARADRRRRAPGRPSSGTATGRATAPGRRPRPRPCRPAAASTPVSRDIRAPTIAPADRGRRRRRCGGGPAPAARRGRAAPATIGLDVRHDHVRVDVDDRCGAARSCRLRHELRRRRAIRPGTSPRSWSSIHWPSCTEASTTVRARS